MSAGPQQLPPPTNLRLLPVLATVVYLAALVALWGLTSLLLDVEVIGQADAGPLLGPAMAAVACVVTWLAARRRVHGVWLRAGAATVSVVAAMLVIGAIGYAVTRGDMAWLILFIGSYAANPFVFGAGVLAGLTVVSVESIRRLESR